MKATFKRYWPFFKDYKGYFLLVLLGIILTVTATAATAHIMQPLMDDMFINRDPDMLLIIPISLIGIYVVKSLGRYIQAVFTNHIGLHIVSRLREILLEKILYLDMEFLYANRSGELISRITNDINRVQYFVSNMLPELIREVLTVVALVGYVIYLDTSLSFYAFIVIPLIIYPLIRIAKRLKKLSHRSQEKNADVVTRLTEVFNNNEVIKANATEAYEMRRFSNENWHFFKINMKAVYSSELISPLLEIIAASGLAAIIYIGGQKVYAGTMSVGEFTAFLTAVGLVFQPIRRIGSIYGKIQDAIAASERIFAILDKDAKIIDGTITLTEDIQSLVFDSVSLHYGDKQALKNISFELKAGETIALVGDSGGGKSSLINLLMRFYDPSSGSLHVNQKEISQYSQHSLRHHIAIVTQRVYIFQDSLAANVAYGEEINEKRVYEALKLADALEFAKGLDEGIYTPMEEFGANLSGGQRQRLAIARAIYKHASLLILDEATSALDNASEQRIQDALENYAKDKITIIIAHRLDTIKHADTILIFKEGQIIDSGNYEQLLEHSVEFQKLLK
ncbi:MAG: ABC transporter transmembrane domain-containing protein [Campylobacterota bacterium]|nr:ABC transporter transmembrane domain-containing protein [Campylobacterota bacterium]